MTTRTTHHRQYAHRGADLATNVELASDTATYLTGDTIESAITSIDERLVAMEALSGFFQGVVDALSVLGIYIRLANDHPLLSEIVERTVTLERTASDSLTSSDSAAQPRNRTASDTPTTSDAAIAVVN